MSEPNSPLRPLHRPRSWAFAAVVAGLCGVASLAYADDAAAPTLDELVTKLADQKMIMDTLWVMVAGFLVFFMNAGFALLEAGLCRAKNASTILGKNFIVFAAATVAFWLLGFNLMFSDGSPILGSFSLFLGDLDNYDSLAW